MPCCQKFRALRNGPIAAASLALVALALCAAPARAVITDTDWSLRISEREKAFRPATDVMAMKALMWEMPYSRMAARNVPFICLTNESATASITQFKMTIGDEQFNFGNSIFGTYAKLGKEFPTLNIASSIQDGGNTLIVDFLNGGLAPGQTVDFQIDLDIDAQFAGAFYKHPDYRTVLFDMNGDNHYLNAGITNDPDSSDNAKVTLTFAQTGQPSLQTLPTPFNDPAVLDGSSRYVNANLARYGDSDPIRAFSLAGGTAIPEPASAALALFGLVAMLPQFARYRRSPRIVTKR
jgi:hypothetical protein